VPQDGGIPTREWAFVLVAASVLLLPPVSAAASGDLRLVTVHFDVGQTTILAGVADFRASCDVIASGEDIALRDNESARTTVAATAGNCSMVLVLFGVDVTIPTINTTPLGKSSLYLPGLAIATLGIVDVSVDLQTSLNSTTRAEDPAVASVEPQELPWPAWGAQRLEVRGAHGFGDFAATKLNTTFTYRVSLGLTVYALGVVLYHADLTDLGSYVGLPSLRTDVTVDLLPSPLALGDPEDVTHEGATLRWSGTADADVDHLEVWVAGGGLNASYRLPDLRASSLRVPLRAEVRYLAWVVVVDRAGQASASNVVAFTTPAAPAPEVPPPPSQESLEARANAAIVGTVVVLAIVAVIVAFALGEIRGRSKREP